LFQEVRGLRFGELICAVSKDFGHVFLCYRTVSLVRCSFSQFFAPGGRDVLGFSTVRLAFPDGLPAQR
jgi:hypothetical protein